MTLDFSRRALEVPNDLTLLLNLDINHGYELEDSASEILCWDVMAMDDSTLVTPQGLSLPFSCVNDQTWLMDINREEVIQFVKELTNTTAFNNWANNNYGYESDDDGYWEPEITITEIGVSVNAHRAFNGVIPARISMTQTEESGETRLKSVNTTVTLRRDYNTNSLADLIYEVISPEIVAKGKLHYDGVTIIPTSPGVEEIYLRQNLTTPRSPYEVHSYTIMDAAWELAHEPKNSKWTICRVPPAPVRDGIALIELTNAPGMVFPAIVSNKLFAQPFSGVIIPPEAIRKYKFVHLSKRDDT